MVPGALEPELFEMSLDGAFQMQPEEYCASVLAQTCEAALRHHQSSPGMFINYQQLPDAVWETMVDFFGIEVSESDIQAFRRVTQLNAKNPSLEFEVDSKAKQNSASKAIRHAAEEWLDPIYDRLEAARLANPATTNRL